VYLLGVPVSRTGDQTPRETTIRETMEVRCVLDFQTRIETKIEDVGEDVAVR
jgi:hypothetical protein